MRAVPPKREPRPSRLIACTSDVAFGTENFEQAMKLAERTIQFADTLTILTDGYIKAGRVSHAEGATPGATRHFTEATKGTVVNAMAALGLAQIQLKAGKTLTGGRLMTLAESCPHRRNPCRHPYTRLLSSISEQPAFC
jgi:hypothetical protein